MDQQGLHNFWTDMMVQRSVMETNSARNPTAVLSGPPDDPTQMVTPAPPRPHQSDSFLDGEKTGATLLFSGVFLALMGATFTTMGWQHYLANPNFEWTKLLGPILISIGGTFILTGVYKFGIFCWPCRQRNEEQLVMPAMEQTSTGHSFTLSSINQPIMLHGATTMVCIPPMYNFVTQEACHAIDFQPGRSVNGILAALPPHDTVYCVENPALTAAEEDSSAHSTETDRRRSRTEKTENERERGDESGSTCSRPPAYEDIYPSFNKHNPT